MTSWGGGAGEFSQRLRAPDLTNVCTPVCHLQFSALCPEEPEALEAAFQSRAEVKVWFLGRGQSLVPGTGELTWWLRTLAVAEDLGSIPQPYMEAHYLSKFQCACSAQTYMQATALINIK